MQIKNFFIFTIIIFIFLGNSYHILILIILFNKYLKILKELQMKWILIVKTKKRNLFSFFFYFILLILLINCEKKYPVEIKNEDKVIVCNDSSFYDPAFPANIKTIYACNHSRGLYYTDYDSINFIKIADLNQSPRSYYLSTENKLLVVASFNMLYFISTESKKLLHQLYIPNSENPNINIGPDEVRLFPCHWDNNYCILVDRSVFLVNLQNMTLEKTIWDVTSFTNMNWIHSMSINEENTILYILLFFYDCWPIDEELVQCDYRQAIAELILQTGEFTVFYDYSKGVPPPGSKEILNTDSYVLAYDYNKKIFLKFRKTNKKLVNSFPLTMPTMYPPAANTHSIFEAFPLSDKTIIVTNNRTFFQLDPVKEILNIYMPIFYDSTSYKLIQPQKGGDYYACINDVNYGKIINVTRKKILKDFYFEDIETFILEEKKNEK